MNLVKQLIFVLFLGQYMLSATGCASALGFGIGADKDSKKIKKFGVPAKQTAPLQVRENSHIQIFLKNGQRQDGEFVKLMKQKIGDEYIESIVWQEMANNQQISTQVAEIEQMITIEDEQSKWIDLKEVASIRKDSRIEIFLKEGQQLEGRCIRQMEQQVGNEYVTTIEWYDKINKRQVSTQIADIEGMVVKQKRNGKWKGLGIGIAIDGIVILAAGFGESGIGSGFSFGGISLGF